MDARHFDVLTRAFGALIRRRVVLGAGVIGILGILASDDARAGTKKPNTTGKKKNKQKKPTCKSPKVKCGKACCKAGQRCLDGKCLAGCEFPSIPLPSGTTLTLQESCVTTATLSLPEGVTLDGAGKTIRFAGPVSGYQTVDSNGTSVHAGFLLQATNVTVRDLILDQSALACETGQVHSAMVIEGAGVTIEAVTITTAGEDLRCYRGIDAETEVPSLRFLADGVTITGLYASGIAVAGPFNATVKNSRVEECLFGIAARKLLTSLDIDTNVVTASTGGILLGRAGANVTVRNNTVTGRAGGSNFFGIHIDDSAGAVTGNTIANYTCGIKLEDDAGVVTGIDPNENTITPSITGQAICDERP